MTEFTHPVEDNACQTLPAWKWCRLYHVVGDLTSQYVPWQRTPSSMPSDPLTLTKGEILSYKLDKPAHSPFSTTMGIWVMHGLDRYGVWSTSNGINWDLVLVRGEIPSGTRIVYENPDDDDDHDTRLPRLIRTEVWIPRSVEDRRYPIEEGTP